MKDDTVHQTTDTAEDQVKEEQSEDLQLRVEELENNWKRAVADYRNLEKRVAEERVEFVKFANRELLERLLPAFDTLFLAEKYIQDDGLKLTVKSLYDALNQVGVERIETENKKFDAKLMDCVETVDGEEDKVIEEIRPGFALYDKVIRPALVKVGKKKGS